MDTSGEHVARPSLLAIVGRADDDLQRALRAELDGWYVVTCTVDDVATAARAFRVSLVLVLGDVHFAASTWSDLEGLAIGPQRVAYAPTIDLAATAVDRIVHPERARRRRG